MYVLDTGKQLMEKDILHRKESHLSLMRNEFIKVAQRMYTEYSEIYSSEPCIQDEDRSGHDMNSCEECKTAQENFCRGEVKEDIPL